MVLPIVLLLPLPATPPRPPGGLPQEAPQSMVEAVIDAFPRGDRQVYLSPVLLANVTGRVRHRKEELDRVRERFGARIMTPEEAIRCPEPDRPDRCTIPGHGVVFQLFLPSPLQGGRLPLRVVLFYDGKGEGGQILREMWDLVLRKEPVVGWIVERKRLVAVAQGPP